MRVPPLLRSAALSARAGADGEGTPPPRAALSPQRALSPSATSKKTMGLPAVVARSCHATVPAITRAAAAPTAPPKRRPRACLLVPPRSFLPLRTCCAQRRRRRAALRRPAPRRAGSSCSPSRVAGPGGVRGGAGRRSGGTEWRARRTRRHTYSSAKYGEPASATPRGARQRQQQQRLVLGCVATSAPGWGSAGGAASGRAGGSKQSNARKQRDSMERATDSPLTSRA